MTSSLLTVTLLSYALASTVSASGGKIMVDNDEWTLSDSGFSIEGPSNGAAYVRNSARFLTGRADRARIWINSDSFGLTSSSLRSALAAYTVTDTGTFSPFTLDDLRFYSAVFLSGNNLTEAEEVALIIYVKAGGGVYVAAGTGNITGGAAGEAAQWNTVLNEFSLNLASSFNGIDGTIATNSTSLILDGVSQLFYDNGNSVNVTGADAQIITQTNGQGLIGVYSDCAPECTLSSAKESVDYSNTP